MKGMPSFWLILAAQSLSAGGEVFGQRSTRKLHNNSSIRSIISLTIYSSIQAFIVLLITELALPASVTGNQGSLSMW